MVIHAGLQETDRWTPKRVSEKLLNVMTTVFGNLVDFYTDDLPQADVDLSKLSWDYIGNHKPQLARLLRQAMEDKKLVPRAVWYSARRSPQMPRGVSPHEKVQASDNPVFELLLKTYLPDAGSIDHPPVVLSLGCGLNLEGPAVVEYLHRENSGVKHSGILIGIDKDPEQILAGQKLFKDTGRNDKIYFICADVLSKAAKTALEARLEAEGAWEIEVEYGEAEGFGRGIDALVMRNFPITKEDQWRSALERYAGYLNNAIVIITAAKHEELEIIQKDGLPKGYRLLAAERNRARVLNEVRDSRTWSPAKAQQLNRLSLRTHLIGCEPYAPKQKPTSFQSSRMTDQYVVIASKK